MDKNGNGDELTDVSRELTIRKLHELRAALDSRFDASLPGAKPAWRGGCDHPRVLDVALALNDAHESFRRWYADCEELVLGSALPSEQQVAALRSVRQIFRTVSLMHGIVFAT